MVYTIISFIVILLLVVAMSLILKNTVKEVDKKSKSYFVDKLKEYDWGQKAIRIYDLDGHMIEIGETASV